MHNFVKSWRLAYFFLQTQQKLLFRQRHKPAQKHDPKLKELEDECLQALATTLKKQTPFKIFSILKIMEVSSNVASPLYWEAMRESLVYNADCESALDLVFILKDVKDNPFFQEEDFWRKMSEKALLLRDKFTLADLIDLFAFYKEQRKIPMVRTLIQECKSYAVEEIEILNIKDTLTVIEMYSGDTNFKKFLGKHLKDKMLKN